MKEEQNIKRSGNAIKRLTIILAIVLIAMIGFVGIYTPKQNRMENIVKGYELAKDLKGARVVTIEPKENKETIIKDAEGNKIEEELTEEQIQEKGYTKEEIDHNEGKMTRENFIKIKEVIDKRLEKMDIKDYSTRLDETTGKIILEAEENEQTDNIVSNFGATGKFEIIDSETKEVLMNNDDIKEAKVLYNTETSGTNVFLGIVFNKEGTSKLENITKTYAEEEDKPNEEETEENEENVENETNEENSEETTNEETNDEETTSEETNDEEAKKQVTLKIDEEEIMTTAFEQPITTGILRLSVGQVAEDAKTVNENAKRAQIIAIGLSYGSLPINYEVTGNEYVISNITNNQIRNIIIVIASIIALCILVLIIKYKMNGILGGLSIVGFIAVYLILIRYTNVIISLEGILGIAIAILINYFIVKTILRQIDKSANKKEIKKEYGKFFVKIIPICIMTIVFCFIKTTSISSFGMTMFWGILLVALYNLIITLPLLKMKENKEEED